MSAVSHCVMSSQDFSQHCQPPLCWPRQENWQHESGAAVTREDLMMTLQNVEAIMIQTVYDNKMASVGLADIAMDTTSVEYTQLGVALAVEECRSVR